jgi:hypothetical protein
VIDFFLMGLGVGAVAVAVNARDWNAFLAAFLFVFAITGIGNGSTMSGGMASCVTLVPRLPPAAFRPSGRPCLLTG